MSGQRSHRAGGGRASVSIIIPAYNAEDTLDDALASLQAQTVRHWEAIVVDDGSTDTTAEVAARWAERNPRISLIRQSNQGASAARNAGIKAAKHDWLVFLDADDWLARDYLWHMRRPLVHNPELDAVFCRAIGIFSDGTREPFAPLPAVEALFISMTGDCPIAVNAALVRRSQVEAVGLFDVHLSTCEDWDLWQRLTRTEGRFAVLDRALAFVRLWQGSLTRRNPERLAREGAEVIGRGHRRDPRVRAPSAEWAEGAPEEDLVSALYGLVCWAAGIGLARDVNVCPLLDLLPVDRASSIPPAKLASDLISGIVHGACRDRRAIAQLWPMLSVGNFLVGLEDRVGVPDLARHVRRHFEQQILTEADLGRPITLSETHGLPIDVDKGLYDVVVPNHVDRVVCVLRAAGRRIVSLVLPVRHRVITAAELRRAIILDGRAGPLLLRHFLLRPHWRAVRLWLRFAKLILSERGRDFLLGFVQANSAARSERLRAFLLSTARDMTRRWDLLEPKNEQASSGAACMAVTEKAGERGDSHVTGKGCQDPCQASYWEAIFAVPDPWQYTSDYEQTKYRQALELLPPFQRPGRALELACAEGHFTVQLAGRVRELVATDISTAALERARQRCAGLDNVTFERLDLRFDALPGGFDLIVCSEVLYYLERRAEIRRLAQRLIEHLEPGGWLLMAHANLAAEDPDETGFNWRHPLGARGIGEVFEALPALRLVRELRTPLYRIHLFQRRIDGANLRHPPEFIKLPVSAKLDYMVSSQVLWNGALARRRREVTERLPILMYHRVSSEGAPGLARYRVTSEQLERQLQYLQRQGYYGVDIETWGEAINTGRGLPGRAVMITFDDAYLDFRTTAWPILEQYGFPVMLFVVVERVGGCADWDRAYGVPAPLMSWSDLRRLAEEGIRFGSHGLDHRPLSSLSPEEMLDQGARSREILQERLGRAVDAIAYPFGDNDALVQRLMTECGYRFGFTTEPACSQLSSHLMALSRVEITGYDDLDHFVAKLGNACAYNALRTLRNGLFDGIDVLRRLT